ncbi:MAG: GNAT family N-acetyltransferase [Acidobacteriota bacterium]
MLAVRPLLSADLAAVARLDAALTGRRKRAYWAAVIASAARRPQGDPLVALAGLVDDSLAGYLLGEVRAFEFGSDPCGWILGLGVDPARAHLGLGSALVADAARRFAAAGVDRVRTMVRRHDVPMLAFFRSNGFVGGPFTELELVIGPGGTQPRRRRVDTRQHR